MQTLIIKYLNETISEAEKLQLIEWLKTSKNRKTFKEFVRINHRLNKLSVSADSEKAYKNLAVNNSEAMPVGRQGKRKTPIRKLIPDWLKYAAVFVGVAIIGYGIYFNSPQKDTLTATPQITLQLEDGSIRIVDENNQTFIFDEDGNRISEQKRDELIYTNNDVSQTVEYNTLSVPYGKTFKLALSDGTQVVLNAGTELKFPVNFIKDENRTVFLNGEAYFEVAKDAEHPFVVNTQDMDVEVLGTHFNVTSYTDDRKTFTVLVEGKVAAHDKMGSNDTKILNPNERAFFENGKLQIEAVNVAKYIAWVQGELIFADDSFKVIANKLERKFNVKIDNNYAELANINITATFTNETIDEVLSTFQSYKNFDYVIKNRTVTISRPKK